MAYRIEFSSRAKADLETIYVAKNAAESDAAARWFNGLVDEIRSLAVMPNRCPAAPEAKKAKRKLRNLLYGNKPHIYRVIFEIEERAKIVRVITIRHGARSAARLSELH
jgi:plasmid stabilization system protein ParE